MRRIPVEQGRDFPGERPKQRHGGKGVQECSERVHKDDRASRRTCWSRDLENLSFHTGRVHFIRQIIESQVLF